jgi:hypothetical protein
MALFISVLGLAGLAIFALIGGALYAVDETKRASRRPLFLARQYMMWHFA